MSLSDLPFLRPTIKLTNRRIQLAVYGHIISNIAGFFMIVSGLMNIFNSFLGALIGLLAGIFILAVELDKLDIPLLKDALNRGVLWILLGAFSFGLDLLAIILIFVGGAFYLVYHYQ